MDSGFLGLHAIDIQRFLYNKIDILVRVHHSYGMDPQATQTGLYLVLNRRAHTFNGHQTQFECF